MGLWLIRVFFIIIFSVLGYQIGHNYNNEVFGLTLAICLSLFVVFAEVVMKTLSLRGLSSTVFGLLLGFVMARMVMWTLQLLPIQENILETVNIVLIFLFAYLGMVVGLRGQQPQPKS